MEDPYKTVNFVTPKIYFFTDLLNIYTIYLYFYLCISLLILFHSNLVTIYYDQTRVMVNISGYF